MKSFIYLYNKTKPKVGTFSFYKNSTFPHLVILKNSKIFIIPRKPQIIPSPVMNLLEQGVSLFIKNHQNYF